MKLETSLTAALTEKDQTPSQLYASKKELDDLTEKFTFEGQKLQSQVNCIKRLTES